MAKATQNIPVAKGKGGLTNDMGVNESNQGLKKRAKQGRTTKPSIGRGVIVNLLATGLSHQGEVKQAAPSSPEDETKRRSLVDRRRKQARKRKVSPWKKVGKKRKSRRGPIHNIEKPKKTERHSNLCQQRQ